MSKKKQIPSYYKKNGIHWALNGAARRMFKKSNTPFIDYKTKRLVGKVNSIPDVNKEKGKSNGKD